MDDHIRIASITKTFTATVVLQVVDEGVLSLDDWLEPFVAGIANGEQITVRQLLNMTAGVFDYVVDPVFAPAYEADPGLTFSPEQALAIMREQPADIDRPRGAQTSTARQGITQRSASRHPTAWWR
jgi:D-alanyl-D-alanine carboxypeptidase